MHDGLGRHARGRKRAADCRRVRLLSAAEILGMDASGYEQAVDTERGGTRQVRTD